MRSIKCLLATLILWASPLFAGNWYVSKAVSSSGGGTSWTDAWKDFNNISFSSVSCGDTIWIAGGTAYSGSMTIAKTCTAGNVLTLKRVLSTDSVPTSAAGWNAAFDSQVVNNNGTVTFGSVSYVTIDGRVGDAASGTAYGIQWAYTGNGLTAFSNTSSTINNITLSHVELWGPSCAASGTCSNSCWGLNLNMGQDNNTTVDHSWIHRFAEVIRPYETSNLTIQYSYIGEDVAVTSADHEDWIYAAPSCQIVAIGSHFYSSGNDGIFMDYGGCANSVFINNTFAHWGFWAISLGKTGTCGPYVIVGNTFANDSLGSDGAGNEYPYGVMGSGGCTLDTSSVVANNIFYNTALDDLANSYTTYNGGTTSNGNSFSCGTGCFSYSLASPIYNFTGFTTFVASGTPSSAVAVAVDFHLTSAGKTLFQAKGTNLTSMCSTYPAICLDKDGNSRPASGAWTVGAYEATTSSPTISAPAALMLSENMSRSDFK